ncbi:uncharacterized protein B0H64DRAFT_446355 [Chaetomium fimeti]|uniref:Uncharacterized protein n=1 Tax=Chaetomium fimeti TaxID=1854472 RepID=A0AAE0LMY3_9PEZI|nr:hypothetical protein B0H64DRAFT_446355 [Chaetomium fimeti]
MAGTEFITIINNSGKVISTGKQLVNIFKEAQAAYRDRRDAGKAERAERAGIQRAKTFDVAPREDSYFDNYHYGGGHPDDFDQDYDRRSLRDGFGRRKSHDDDARSQASSRHSRQSRRSRRPRSPERALMLTEGNLKTHSEVSATTPSKAHRAPYAETAPRDMPPSRPPLAIGAPPASESAAPAGALISAAPPERRQLVHRPRSDLGITRKKSVDMDLAYGDIPPDLESRVDLDTGHRDPVYNDAGGAPDHEDPQETQAINLMDRIEDYLEEAHCVQHTASSMIENLQRNPEAAAAVALSLAELSALVGKMSPAFLAFLKGGSPAVFALLASPQFLIGAGVAVGVTVVMFGGWKIVKRLGAAATATKTLETPLEMRAMPVPAAAPTAAPERALPPAPARAPSAASYDEALVLREVEELSSIESWRRGIVGGVEDESADIELISREAERALKEKHNLDLPDEVEPCDSVSQVSRAPRSERSSRSHRGHRSSGSRKHRERDEETQVSERRSSSGRKDRDGGESVAGSERSHRSHRSSRSSRSHEGSSVSRSSKHSAKITLKAIEEGDDDSASAAGKPKEKKRDMIKQLFKMKKDKDDRDRAMSVMV